MTRALAHIRLRRRPAAAMCPADLGDLNDKELLRRAVVNLRPEGGVQAPRWCVVMDALGLTSVAAVQLCRRLNVDAKERMDR